MCYVFTEMERRQKFSRSHSKTKTHQRCQMLGGIFFLKLYLEATEVLISFFYPARIFQVIEYFLGEVANSISDKKLTKTNLILKSVL